MASEAPQADGPKRQVKGDEDEAPAAEEGTLVNLTSAIAVHLKALGDANWKERQAGITAVDEIITKAKPLGCTGVYMDAACGDLWPALKARLKDSNKNLATQTLLVLAKIAQASGQPVEKYAKTVMPNMLALISDNKKTVRDAVLMCLTAWGERISPEVLLRHLPLAVSVDSPAGREDAVKWAAEYLSKIDRAKCTTLDLSPVLAPVMECLEHRVAEVRNGAEKCLIAIISCSGTNAMHKCMRDMKPAQVCVCVWCLFACSGMTISLFSTHTHTHILSPSLARKHKGCVCDFIYKLLSAYFSVNVAAFLFVFCQTFS